MKRKKAQVFKRKGITVTNRTYYSSSDIGAIVAACMKEHATTHGAHRHYHVEIDYTHKWDTNGWGYYHQGHFKIGLANPNGTQEEWFKPEDSEYTGPAINGGWKRKRVKINRVTAMVSAARVIEHEMFHCMGFCHTHSRHAGARYSPMPDLVNHTNQETPWADGLELRYEEPEKKAKPSGLAYHEKKRELALNRIDTLTDNLIALDKQIAQKRALVKKWQREVTLRNRMMRAAGGSKCK